MYDLLYGKIANLHFDQLSVGLIAQLVEHSTGIAEIMNGFEFKTEFFSGFHFTTA